MLRHLQATMQSTGIPREIEDQDTSPLQPSGDRFLRNLLDRIKFSEEFAKGVKDVITDIKMEYKTNEANE